MFAFIQNLIYPKFCVNCRHFGSYLCVTCEKEVEFLQLQYCPGCKYVSKRGLTHKWCRTKTRLDGIQSLVYYAGPIRTLIQQIKYRHSFAIVAELLPQLLPKTFLEFEPDLMIVPVPLSKERYQTRGFNQSEIIAKALGDAFTEPVETKWLKRIKNTATQTRLTREERILNLKDTFVASSEVRGKSVLLIDDVWTTGSTLNEAANELKRKGAKRVYAFTIAVGK